MCGTKKGRAGNTPEWEDTQRDSFVYLGEAICGDGNSDTKIRRRMTANVRRKVKGVTGDRWILHKLKVRVLTLCVTQAYMYGLEMMALTEKQQEKV